MLSERPEARSGTSLPAHLATFSCKTAGLRDLGVSDVDSLYSHSLEAEGLVEFHLNENSSNFDPMFAFSLDG